MQMVTGWMLLLLSIAGNTEWWVIAVNRSHALPIRAHRLRRFRTFHDLAVIGFPFFLAWCTGFGKTSLLFGGSFSEQSPALQWLLIVTIAGCVPLLLATIRWQSIRRKQFHHSAERERHDVLSLSSSPESSTRITGPRRRTSQKWPWNEIYHLEVNSKIVRLPGSTSTGEVKARPLKVVHFSDLHFIGCPGEDYYRFLVAQAIAMKADIYVFTGDLIDDMSLLDVAVDILRPLAELAPSYFILGNHDWRYEFEHIRSALSAAGWICVTSSFQLVTVHETRVLIAGSELPWMGDPPPAVRDAGCDLRILLSHSPDQFRFAQRCGYDLMLSGHTHGGQVVLPVIGPVYAPSIYGVSFVSGLFRLGNLTLHVTRGVGAKDPMRWNCPPELTCLEVFI